MISDVGLRNCTVMYFALQWWKQRNNNPPALPSCREVQSSRYSELHKVLSRRVFRSKKCSVFMQIQILQDTSSSDWIIRCMRKTKASSGYGLMPINISIYPILTSSTITLFSKLPNFRKYFRNGPFFPKNFVKFRKKC